MHKVIVIGKETFSYYYFGHLIIEFVADTYIFLWLAHFNSILHISFVNHGDLILHFRNFVVVVVLVLAMTMFPVLSKCRKCSFAHF